MFGFVDTSRQNPVSAVDARNASVSAATSIGSPTAVPVPWASSSWIVARRQPGDGERFLHDVGVAVDARREVADLALRRRC